MQSIIKGDPIWGIMRPKTDLGLDMDKIDQQPIGNITIPTLAHLFH